MVGTLVLILAAIADCWITTKALSQGRTEWNALYPWLAKELRLSVTAAVWSANVLAVIIVATIAANGYGWLLYGPVAGLHLVAAGLNVYRMRRA